MQVTAVICIALGASSWANVAHGSGIDTGVVWETQAVRHPVVVRDLQPQPPYVPAKVALRREPLDVGPDRAAALWLGSAELIRVRVLSEQPARPAGASLPSDRERIRFGRVTGRASGGRLVTDEPGMRMGSDEWYLVQPPGGGNIWYITAEQPTRIVVERPRELQARLYWEQLRTRILDWIDHDGPMPSIPMTAGSDHIELALRSDRAIAMAITHSYPSALTLANVIREWRKASALAALETLRPALLPYQARRRIDQSFGREITLSLGKDGGPAPGRSYRQVTEERTSWTLDLEGPGVLRVQTRAANAIKTKDDDVRRLAIEVTSKGTLLGRDAGPAVPALARVSPRWLAAMPIIDDDGQGARLLADGKPVSLRRELAVPLFPGRHTYRLSVEGGPALVRASVVERRPRLGEVVTRRSDYTAYIQRARRMLGQIRQGAAPARALAELLLGQLESPTPGLPAEIAGLPAILQLIALHSRARQQRPDPATIAALAARVIRLLDQISPEIKSKNHPDVRPETGRDGATGAEAGSQTPARPFSTPDDHRFVGDQVLQNPLLIWRLRIAFAQAFTRWGARQHVVALVPTRGAPPPVDLLGAFGDLLAEVPSLPAFPSLALRAAALSWLERPAHPDRRRAYLSIWRQKTLWSILPPTVKKENDDTISWRWVSNTARGLDCREADIRGAVRLFHVPLGAACFVQAPELEIEPLRPAVIRVHLYTPDDNPGPVTIRVGERSWSLLAFSRFETVAIAAPPGRYSVQVDGPARTLAYVALPSRLEGLNLRGTPVRRRWPLSVSGEPIRYRLPAPAGAAPIQIELREVVAEGNQPERTAIPITLHTDVGTRIELEMTPGALESEFVNLRAPGKLTAPVKTVLWLPPKVREVWLSTTSKRQLVAAFAIRRAAGHAIGNAAIIEALEAEPKRSATRDEPPQSSCRKAPIKARNPLIDQLYQQSRCLLEQPGDDRARLARSQLYWELGRQNYARRDIEYLLGLDLDETVPREVAQQLDEWRRSTHLRLQPRPSQINGPTAIAPAWLAMGLGPADLRPWIPLVRRARIVGIEDALERLATIRPASERAADQADAPPAHAVVAAYVAARLHDMRTDHRAAAAALLYAYTRSKDWQLGLATLKQLTRVLEAGGPELSARRDTSSPHEPTNQLVDRSLASLTYGIALELRQIVEHVTIRHALVTAGRRSRWQPVRGAERHAGFESLFFDDGQAAPDLGRQIEWARLAPPWHDSNSQRIKAGQDARVRVFLKRKTRIWPRIFCRDLDDQPGDRSTRSPCRIRVQVNQQPAQEFDVAHARPVALAAIELPPGAHQVDVGLMGSTRGLRASVRFMSDRLIAPRLENLQKQASSPSSSQGHVIPVRRPSRTYWARPGKAISVVVAGPAALHVEMRATEGQPATRARISYAALDPAPTAAARTGPAGDQRPGATPGSPASPPAESTAQPVTTSNPSSRTIELDPTVDGAIDSENRRGVRVHRPTTELVVIERPGPHQLIIEPTDGELVARLSLRVDAAAELESDVERRVLREAGNAAAAAAWAWIPYSPRFSPIHLMARPAQPDRSFTLAAEVGAGRDDVGTSDLDDLGNSRFDLTVFWRQQTSPKRLWLGASVWTRWRLDTTLAAGGDLRVQLRRLPLGLRFGAFGRWAQQKIEECCLTWSGRGQFALSRSFQLTPSMWLIPGVRFDAEHYEINPGAEDRFPFLDPRVFSPYSKDHSLGLIPRASLYWLPLQDQIAVLSAYAVSNADLRTVDNVGVRAKWEGMIETSHLFGPTFELSYRLSRRFNDEHRETAYFRHDIGAGLAWPLWRGRAGRLTLGLSDRLFLSGIRKENVFRVELRFDWTAGRGLRDFSPPEIDFLDFEEPRLWSSIR